MQATKKNKFSIPHSTALHPSRPLTNSLYQPHYEPASRYVRELHWQQRLAQLFARQRY